MPDRLRLTILGCSSSPGVPHINGDWGACAPANPRNRRLRAAALVERIGASGVTSVAIDCGPDFREQMLSAKVERLDAVLLTHAHADHIHGLDDLRGFMLNGLDGAWIDETQRRDWRAQWSDAFDHLRSRLGDAPTSSQSHA